jgi:hypothetical protein
MSTSDTTTPTVQPARAVFTEQQVVDALNHDAEDILRATDGGDGLHDAMDLMINAVVGYLTGQATDLHQVVQQRYANTYATVLGWIQEAAR